MNDKAISIDNIGKLYRLGEIGTGTISHDLNRWWSKLRGKEDPYLKIGTTNNRAVKEDSEYVWALRNISFDVMKGEAIAIVGRNGAGKSTLLKILSKVTAPTEGAVKINGRIASLLEVGTGFHPDLTGRENIFMNGAILGMSKNEIRSKFDEIVDFAGVGKYVDTPVKRYSSGMYVRLAFGVAAHLEPDILIVDEVLAVGDAEFQKKCLGKMRDVSQNEGRTVLFVSHNLTAVQTLCTKAVLLQNGAFKNIGKAGEIVNEYLNIYAETNLKQQWDRDSAPGNSEVKLLRAMITPPQGDNFYVGESVEIEFDFLNLGDGKEHEYDVTFHLTDEMGNLVFVASSGFESNCLQVSGKFSAKTIIPEYLLHEGTYTIKRLLFLRSKGTVVYEHGDVLTFEVVPKNQLLGWMGKKEGIVRPRLNWQINIEND